MSNIPEEVPGEEGRARDAAGAMYRFRRIGGEGDRPLKGGDVLDIIQSLRFALSHHRDRMAKLAVWSECKHFSAANGICRALEQMLADPEARNLSPTLWDRDLWMAAQANIETFRGEMPDDVFDLRSAPRTEFWIPAQPMLYPTSGMDFSPVDAMVTAGAKEQDIDRARKKVHDEWWELPYPCVPIGVLLIPMATPVPVRTFIGEELPAGSAGTLGVMLFVPLVDAPNHRGLPLYLRSPASNPNSRQLTDGPTFVLRPMETCWAGLPAQGFYAPLLAMRWFMDQPFIETSGASMPTEKIKEVEGVLRKQRLTPVTPRVRYVALRPAPATENAGGSGGVTGDSPDGRYAGWWWVRGSIQWRRHGPGRSERRRVWVQGYYKNVEAAAQGKPFIGSTVVQKVKR